MAEKAKVHVVEEGLCRGQVVTRSDWNGGRPVTKRCVVAKGPDADGQFTLIRSGPFPGPPEWTKNADGGWVVVPEHHRTAVERVCVAGVCVDPLSPNITIDTDDRGKLELAEDELPAWHFLYALLPDDAAVGMTCPAGDWPDGSDLALAVAQRVDAMEEILSRLTGSSPRVVQAMVTAHVKETEEQNR